MSNRGYLLTKRAMRVKWQVPPVPQSIHVVAEGDSIDGMGLGSPSATIFCSTLPVVMLTLSLRSIDSITTGYTKARPTGERSPKVSLKNE